MFPRALVILGLLLLEPSDASFSSRLGVSNFFSGVKASALGSVNRLVFDSVDGKALTKMYTPAYQQLKTKLGLSVCAEGLTLDTHNSVDAKIELTNGMVRDVEKVVQSARVTLGDSETNTAIISYTFPSLDISYSFHYSDFRAVTPWERTGRVTMRQEGRNTVEFTVQVPKSQKKIDKMLMDKMCIAKVLEVKNNFAANSLSVKTVDYESLAKSVGWGITEKRVKSIVAGLAEDIIRNVEASLGHLVDEVFRKAAFNCQDALYTQQTTPDCHAVRTATSYSPAV